MVDRTVIVTSTKTINQYKGSGCTCLGRGEWRSTTAGDSEQVVLLLSLTLALRRLDCWRQLYKNRSSRKIDSRRLSSRESDFPKTFSLSENQFSGKTSFFIQFIPAAVFPFFSFFFRAKSILPRFDRFPLTCGNISNQICTQVRGGLL